MQELAGIADEVNIVSVCCVVGHFSIFDKSLSSMNVGHLPRFNLGSNDDISKVLSITFTSVQMPSWF